MGTVITNRNLPLSSDGREVVQLGTHLRYLENSIKLGDRLGGHAHCTGGAVELSPLKIAGSYSQTDMAITCTKCALSVIVPRKIRTVQDLVGCLIHSGIIPATTALT